MKTAIFIRKAWGIDNLIADTKEIRAKGKDGTPYKIVKRITLTAEEFRAFTDDLLNDWDFIKENKDRMQFKDGVWHVLEITARGMKFSILVESEGFDYARYAAIIYR